MDPQRRHCIGLAGWVLVLALWGASGVARAEEEALPVIDRVVAVVEDELITQSQLELEARISLVQRGGLKAGYAQLDEATLGRALELSIAQRLQTREADRLNAFQVDPAELDSAVAAFQTSLGGASPFEDFLKRLETDASTVAAVIGRGIRAEKILDSRVRLRAQVSESEVRRAFQERQASLGRPYEDVRTLLRDQLFRVKYQRLASTELRHLLSGARIRRVAPFAQGTLPEGGEVP